MRQQVTEDGSAELRRALKYGGELHREIIVHENWKKAERDGPRVAFEATRSLISCETETDLNDF